MGRCPVGCLPPLVMYELDEYFDEVQMTNITVKIEDRGVISYRLGKYIIGKRTNWREWLEGLVCRLWSTRISVCHHGVALNGRRGGVRLTGCAMHLGSRRLTFRAGNSEFYTLPLISRFSELLYLQRSDRRARP